MSVQTSTYLKSKFKAGALPEQIDFFDLIDNCFTPALSADHMVIRDFIDNNQITPTLDYSNIGTIITVDNAQDAIAQLESFAILLSGALIK